jgi:hypothetical protein
MDHKDSDSPSVDVASTTGKELREVENVANGEVVESRYAGKPGYTTTSVPTVYVGELTESHRSVTLGFGQDVQKSRALLHDLELGSNE